MFDSIILCFSSGVKAYAAPFQLNPEPAVQQRTAGFLILKNENHQQCWWFQKALAMRKKVPPLMYNKVGLPTKTIKTSKEDQVVKLDTDSLAHTQWNCKYHIVFAPKYRRQIMYGKIKSDIGLMLRKLCEYKGIEIIEAEACKDHIHMLVSIPPKYSVSQIMGYLKGKSSLMIFEKYANLKYKYGNRHFWCRGYYVDTVGRNKKAIEQYIRNQLQQDYEDDQLSIKEFVDPFTGEPVKGGK